MIKLDTILVAHDFSEAGFDAFTEACAVAQTFGSKVVIVHAIPEAPEHSQDYDVVAFKAAEMLKALCSSPDHEEVNFADPVIRAGDPARLILGVSAELSADLIVIGSGEKTTLDRILLGSTAERVVRESSRPVLLVRPGHPHREVKGIACAIDASEPAHLALEVAAYLARTFVSDLRLISVAKPGDAAAQRGRLEESSNKVDLHGIPVTMDVPEGSDAAPAIVEAITRARTDLLVLGSAGRKGLARLFRPNTAEGVLRLAPCSILTVCPPKF